MEDEDVNNHVLHQKWASHRDSASRGHGVYQVSDRDQANEIRVRICNLCIFRTYCNKNVYNNSVIHYSRVIYKQV